MKQKCFLKYLYIKDICLKLAATHFILLNLVKKLMLNFVTCMQKSAECCLCKIPWVRYEVKFIMMQFDTDQF